MCEFRIDDSEKWEWLPADQLLITQVESIKWTHLSCFFLIQMAEIINLKDLDAHYAVYFNIASCLIYQSTIIENWIGQHKMPEMLQDENVRNCNVTDNFGSAREWLTYEALSYYMQLL